MPLISTQKLDNGPDYDPLWSNVSFYCKFNGSDAATTATDESDNAHTITFVGDAQLDTADKKFGTASLLTDGTGDECTVASHSSLDLTGDFTLEWHSKHNSVGAGFLMKGTTFNSSHWMIFQPSSPGGGPAEFYQNSVMRLRSSGLNGLGWVHVALTRKGNLFTWWINGAEDTSTTIALTIGTNTEPLYIAGTQTLGSSRRYLNGWMDNVRITKGVARYTSRFNPPVKEYPTTGAA